jgi:hypothetical protein
MRFKAIAIILTFLACASICSAEIIGKAKNDGTGSTDCVGIWQTGTNDNTLVITGTQYWGPGRIIGAFYTDTPDDPTVKVMNSIDNDTDFDWTGYHVNVSMDRPFTISAQSVTTPGDWTATITQQPVQIGSNWIGQLDMASGTPVIIGASLEFGYKITFNGATHYNYDQDLAPVPEPGMLVLLVCGLLGLVVVRRRFA